MLVILLKIGCKELRGQEITFKEYFEGFNGDQHSCVLKPMQKSCSHQRWLKGPVKVLTKVDHVEYDKPNQQKRRLGGDNGS